MPTGYILLLWWEFVCLICQCRSKIVKLGNIHLDLYLIKKWIHFIVIICFLGLQIDGNSWLGCWCFKIYYFDLFLNGNSQVSYLDDLFGVIVSICCIFDFKHLFSGIIMAPYVRWYFCLHDLLGLTFTEFTVRWERSYKIKLYEDNKLEC